MLTVFRYFFGRARGAILGWGITLALLGLYMVGFYDTLAEQREMLTMLIQQYPPELMAFFGGAADLFTPAGYLSLEFFSYIPLVIGIYAVLLGSGLLIGDEENGTLDLLLAQPISRTAFFCGRLLGMAAILAAILGIVWIGFVLGERGTTMDVAALDMLYPFITLFAVLFIFATFSLMLSMILPSRTLTATLGGLLLFVSYFINSLAQLDENLRDLAEYLPLRYYQSGAAIHGLNGDWLLGLFGFGLLFALLAWLLFLQRDIRVSGEGSWRMPFFKTARKQPR